MKIRFVLFVTLVAALAVSSVSWGATVVSANVPFAFRVGNTLFPAGQYRLDCDINSRGMILIQQLDGSASAYVTSIPQGKQVPATETSATLVFHRYSERYFLNLVRVPDTEAAGFPLSKSEAEMISRAVRGDQRTLVAQVVKK